MTKIHIMDPVAGSGRDGWHSISDINGNEGDSLNGNIKMIFLTGIPTTVPTNTQRQPDDWSCGPYAMAEALNKSGEELRQWLQARGLIDSDQGTEHDGIIQCINAYGYSCAYGSGYINGQMNPAAYQTLINHLKSGKKAILLMGGTLSSAGGACRNNYWSRRGHYIAAYGIDEGGTSSGSSTGTSTDYNYQFTVPQIREGSQGAVIKLWQRLLKGRGFNVAIDGSFGPDCKAKTIEFQKAIKITTDGIVGPDTWSSMIPCDSNTSGSSITFKLKEIAPGYQGAEAYFIQNLLRAYGYDTTLDLSYGNKCTAAVKAFQKSRGMAGDGIVGKNTYKHLTGL